ncbi:hypothetical protein F8C76_15685 [Flagellimonas olearia]|uniref:Uncharacterized protein n=1 Tax=Flagellimonas olearia TaxID=552546 RepID=A0A6I1DZG1_9FLAO|nr:hypothetical protein [Allomuricauda olearia]KAB7529271.1 hypothetical protein F8C76_15685 [Allomuricauda olearia]
MEELVKAIENVIKKDAESIYYSKSELKDVIDCISKNKKLEIFFNHCHRLGATSGICFNQNTKFPNKIIQRAKKTNGTKAIEEIFNYIDSKEVHIKCALLLYGIHIDNEFNFSNGVRLINASNMEDSQLVNFLGKETLTLGGIDTAVLIIDYKTPKEFYSTLSPVKKTNWAKVEVKENLIKTLDDTRLMLSLGRSSSFGIPAVGVFEVLPENLEFLNNGIGYTPFPEPRNSFGPSIIKLEMDKADSLLNKFDLLSKDEQDGIRVATKRLNDSKIDSDWANISINLRICLENLFNREGKYPISKTISKRAPHYTSFSKDKTKEIYSFLSTAVHTGIPQTHPNIKEEDIVKEVQNTIIKYIEEGCYPDWSQI